MLQQEKKYMEWLVKYQVIIDNARTDFGWKIIRDSIKEDIKRHEKNM